MNRDIIKDLLIKVSLTPTRIIVLIALWMVLIQNEAFFGALLIDYPMGLDQVGFLICVSIFLIAFIALEFSLLAAVVPVRVAASIVLVVSASTSYFMSEYGTIFDRVMIRNLMATNVSEAQDLIGWSLVQWILLTAVLPILAIWNIPWRASSYGKSLKTYGLTLVASLLIMIACVVPYSSKFTSFAREHKPIHYVANPIYPIYSMVRFIQEILPSANDQPFQPISSSPQTPDWDKDYDLVVIVVGETARTDHFSLNGYPRETNPLLQARDNIISYSNVSSCGTSTAISVPCMFSYQTKDEFNVESAINEENVLDTISKAGVDVLWRDNNSSSKHVADRVTYEDFRTPELNPVCDEECRDVGMIDGLQEYLDGEQGDKLIVLHQMGSHGPAYHLRYPEEFERFSPACKTKELSECSQDELINAYDNSILYTDYFLDQVIVLLENNRHHYEASMIYIGDHGESLGENGVYLHGLPYMLAPKSQTSVPMIVWGGITTDLNMQGTESLKDLPHSHDGLTNALLDLFEIETDTYLKIPHPMIAVSH
jgi:lipid A ethanolaminephosphotransferase